MISTRAIEPGSLVGAGTVLLRYGLQPGAILRYRVRSHARRVADGGPAFSRRSAHEAEARLVLKAVGLDPEDGQVCLVLSREVLDDRVDGMSRPPAPRQVSYLKQDAQGRALESTDPANSSGLLLPDEPVGEGSEWRQSESRMPPGAVVPLDLRLRVRVVEIVDSRVLLEFASEEVAFEGAEGALYRILCRGAATLDSQAGVLLAWREETRLTGKEGDLLTEVTSVTEMDLESADGV